MTGRPIPGQLLSPQRAFDVAPCGLEAVEIVRSQRPDLVVLDVTVPEVDGIATFHLLQQDPVTAGVPVVLLTASQRVGVQSWHGLDVAGVLAKPFDPIQLPVRVEALLADRGRAMAQEA